MQVGDGLQHRYGRLQRLNLLTIGLFVQTDSVEHEDEVAGQMAEDEHQRYNQPHLDCFVSLEVLGFQQGDADFW